MDRFKAWIEDVPNNGIVIVIYLTLFVLILFILALVSNDKSNRKLIEKIRQDQLNEHLKRMKEEIEKEEIEQLKNRLELIKKEEKEKKE